MQRKEEEDPRRVNMNYSLRRKRLVHAVTSEQRLNSFMLLFLHRKFFLHSSPDQLPLILSDFFSKRTFVMYINPDKSYQSYTVFRPVMPILV